MLVLLVRFEYRLLNGVQNVQNLDYMIFEGSKNYEIDSIHRKPKYEYY